MSVDVVETRKQRKTLDLNPRVILTTMLVFFSLSYFLGTICCTSSMCIVLFMLEKCIKCFLHVKLRKKTEADQMEKWKRDL